MQILRRDNMTTILTRYITKTIMLATGLTALVITAILLLMSLLGELKSIGQADYTLMQAFWYVMQRMPNQLYQFFPLLMLLGSIVGLSALTANRELTVMRVYGFSVRRIIYSVLGAAFILIIIAALLGETIGPHLSYRAEIQKENARNGGQAVVTASGVWLHVDNNFIHIQHVVGRELLKGVTRYQYADDHRLLAAYYAKELKYENNTWQMYDAVKTTFYPEQTKSQTFLQAPWDLHFNVNLLNIGLVDPSEMSLPKLAKFIDYLKLNVLQAAEYQYQYWQRIFQPIASLVMIFIAILIVLGTRNSSALGMRIVIGIVVGFIFFISNAFLGHLSIVYQLPPFFAALLPLILFALLGTFYYRYRM
jgi:lipopolysaccharide export system permease protein